MTRLQKKWYVVFSGDCSTVRQPRVEEVSSGGGDIYNVEFCRRVAHLLYRRVLEIQEVWLTKSTFLVAPQERVDSLLITLVDQS